METSRTDGIPNVDGGLHLVACQHPYLDASLGKFVDAFRYLEMEISMGKRRRCLELSRIPTWKKIYSPPFVVYPQQL
jgi:hypothetical protein